MFVEGYIPFLDKDFSEGEAYPLLSHLTKMEASSY